MAELESVFQSCLLWCPQRHTAKKIQTYRNHVGENACMFSRCAKINAHIK
jgi:hypothetical protein